MDLQDSTDLPPPAPPDAATDRGRSETSPLPVSGPWHRGPAARAARRTIPLAAAILVLLTVFRAFVPGFLRPDNLLDMMDQISINAILAMGIMLTILIGGIDLSVGAVQALAGTVTVWCLVAGGPPEQSVARLLLATSAGIGVALALGAINGICAAMTRMPPFIITLGTMLIARGAAERFNSAQPIHIPESEFWFLSLGSGRLFATVPVTVIVMFTIFVLVTVLLHRTRFGQHLYAIGGNREAARFTGISLGRAELSVYLICAALAGVAGIIGASQLYSAEPAGGVGFELDAIAAAVVGGTSLTGGAGTVFGTLLGAVIIGILSKGLNQIGAHFSLQYIIKGLVILGAVFADVRGRQK